MGRGGEGSGGSHGGGGGHFNYGSSETKYTAEYKARQFVMHKSRYVVSR